MYNATLLKPQKQVVVVHDLTRYFGLDGKGVEIFIANVDNEAHADRIFQKRFNASIYREATCGNGCCGSAFSVTSYPLDEFQDTDLNDATLLIIIPDTSRDNPNQTNEETFPNLRRSNNNHNLTERGKPNDTDAL